MSLAIRRRKWASLSVFAVFCVVSSGCEQNTWRVRREPYANTADPYPVYRPAYDTPRPREHHLNGYAGFNYGRLRDWGRVRPRPGEQPSIPTIEAPAS